MQTDANSLGILNSFQFSISPNALSISILRLERDVSIGCKRNLGAYLASGLGWHTVDDRDTKMYAHT